MVTQQQSKVNTNHKNALSNKELLKKTEAAALLTKSVKSVERLVNQGILSRIKIGGSVRFFKKDIEEYLLNLNYRRL